MREALVRGGALVRLLFCLSALLLTSHAVSGQEKTYYLVPVDPKEPAIEATVLVSAPAGRSGGFGYVTVRLTNRSKHARQVSLEIREGRSGGVRIDRRCQLMGGQDSTVHVAVPSSVAWSHMSIRCPGFRSVKSINIQQRLEASLVAMAVGRNGIQRSDWDNLMSAAFGRYFRGRNSRGNTWFNLIFRQYLERSPADLPDSWVKLTRFDLVLVDGSESKITKDAQRLLARYVAGGGYMVIHRPELLPAGELKQMWDQRGSDSPIITHYLGSVFGVSAEVESNRAFEGRLGDWLLGRGRSLGARLADGVSGPVPSEFFHRFPIAGLGNLPTHIFFLIILVFALCVGPLNHLFFRRRRQPWMVLVTVPALGLFVTVTILTFGAFSEGFTMRGQIMSFSILDQEQHRLVSTASRTVYAPLAPSGLAIEPDTYFFTADMLSRGAGGRSRRGPQRQVTSYRFNEDTGRIDGAILPSRTVTNLVSVSQKVCRDRLRFKRRSDGNYDVQHDGRLEPMTGRGSVVFRDDAGQVYVGQADMVRPITDARAMQLVRDWRRNLLPGRQTPDLARYRSAVQNRNRRLVRAMTPALRGGFDAWAERQIPWPIPRSSYIVLLSGFGALESLGIDPAWDNQTHVLIGRLGKGDIID